MPVSFGKTTKLTEFNQNANYLGLGQERSGSALRSNVPAPTGGLNTRDSEATMDPTDAVIMENWFPGQGSVTTRKGFSEYATGLTDYVETLIEYNANTTRKFIACAGGAIKDVTNKTT